MFKTETHIHTTEISSCGKMRAIHIVDAYKEKGYKTIFISDHFDAFYFNQLGDMSWEDKITVFFSGFKKAENYGKSVGVNVLPSVEIDFMDAEFNGNPNHYLLYGDIKEFLLKYPDVYKIGIEEFSKIAKENDIFVVQAHPFRDGACYPTPEYVDAFEVHNTSPRHDDFDDKAIAVAKEHNLYMTGGSDCHRPEDLGLGGIETENEIKTVKDYIDAVKSGKAVILNG